MAAAQDVDSENQQQLSSNYPGDSRGRLSQIRAEVIVLRAYNIPHTKRLFTRKRKFFVTVTNRVTTKSTKSVQIDGQTVQWDQTLGAFSTRRSSHLTLVLYEKRLAHRDTVVGTHEMQIPVASQSDVSFVLSNGDGVTQPATLDLTITVSADMHPTIPNDPREIPTKGDNTLADVAKPSIAPCSEERFHSTAPGPPLPSPDFLSVETSTPTPDSQAEETSPAERAQITLRHADKAKKPTDGVNTWNGAFSRVYRSFRMLDMMEG